MQTKTGKWGNACMSSTYIGVVYTAFLEKNHLHILYIHNSHYEGRVILFKLLETDVKRVLPIHTWKKIYIIRIYTFYEKNLKFS